MKLLLIFRHQWLLIATVYFIAGFFIDALDIAVHDTYFVISGLHAGIAGAALFLLLWALYRCVKAFRTVRWLSAIHLTGTSLAGILLLVLLSGAFVPEAPKRYTDYSVYDALNEPSGWDHNVWIAGTIVAFFLLQATWIVQLVVFFAKRR